MFFITCVMGLFWSPYASFSSLPFSPHCGRSLGSCIILNYFIFYSDSLYLLLSSPDGYYYWGCSLLMPSTNCLLDILVGSFLKFTRLFLHSALFHPFLGLSLTFFPLSPPTFKIYMYIYLAAPGLSCSMQDLLSLLWHAACSLFIWNVWDLVPRPGIKPRPPALGPRSLSTGPPEKAQLPTFFFLILFIYLFLALLGLCCCMGFSLVVPSGGYSLVAVYRASLAVASLAVEHGL